MLNLRRGVVWQRQGLMSSRLNMWAGSGLVPVLHLGSGLRCNVLRKGLASGAVTASVFVRTLRPIGMHLCYTTLFPPEEERSQKKKMREGALEVVRTPCMKNAVAPSAC